MTANIADALGLDRRQAEELAGLVQPTSAVSPGVDLRAAIEMSALTPGLPTRVTCRARRNTHA